MYQPCVQNPHIKGTGLSVCSLERNLYSACHKGCIKRKNCEQSYMQGNFVQKHHERTESPKENLSNPSKKDETSLANHLWSKPLM